MRQSPGLIKRRAVAATVAVILMAAVVTVALRQGPQTDSGSTDSPEECLAELLRAAQEGNVSAYLDCFVGELREQLEAKATASRPPERFAESLRTGVSEMKGWAASETKQTSDGETETRWERIYARYTETYRVRLRQVGGRWRIATLDRLDRGAPAIPYGTPVFPNPEEPQETSKK